MARTRTSYGGPLAISLLLHVTVLGAGLIAWPWLGKTKVVQVTPVTLLTAAQLQKLSAAAQADAPQEAKTEEPVPEAPADEPVPEPKPAPPEPKPAPKVAPAPKTPAPVQPQVADKGPQPKSPTAAPAKPVSRPTPGFNLDDLAASIQKDMPARKTGSAQSSVAKGPSQQELDIARREAEGRAKAATNDFNSQLASQLQRAWHVNCGAEASVRIRVRVQLARDGSLAEAKLVDYASDTAITDPVTRAAATRALAAVSASAPFRNVPPPEAYEQWKSRIVAFDGKDACS
jgi:outer membrane biosynthesis protein TonB